MSMHVGYDLGGRALKAAAGWGTRAVGERSVTRGGAPTSLEGLPGEDTSLGGSVAAAREGVSACASGALVAHRDGAATSQLLDVRRLREGALAKLPMPAHATGH